MRAGKQKDWDCSPRGLESAGRGWRRVLLGASTWLMPCHRFLGDIRPVLSLASTFI